MRRSEVSEEHDKTTSEQVIELIKYVFDKFMDVFKQSIIISGFIATALVVTACYLWGTERVVPNELYIVLGTAIGGFIGGKVEAARKNSIDKNDVSKLEALLELVKRYELHEE